MLPIGIEDFEEIRTQNYYYVDKTGMIRDLLKNKSKVTLFTRPRRFGKSLNMSMLEHFFSIDGDKSIFDGLAISKEKTLCAKYMNQYPVIYLTLKGIDALGYGTAFRQTARLIRSAALKVEYLADSEKLSAANKANYQALLNLDMSEETLGNSLKTLSELLEKHHGRKVILLEYEVPLARAHANNYYNNMISLMRSLLSAALKSNTSLELAVLTGCLRISKESIFTGLNNLKVFSITNAAYDDFFGFTNQEVQKLLNYYEINHIYAAAQEWYDEYHFGNADIYCPWDVINYCFDIQNNPKISPQNYWINTSGNDVIKRFVAMADDRTRDEIEDLVAGGTIEKEIREDLTYSEIYDSIDNLWSVLYTTGYLTQQGRTDGGVLKLKISNREVRDVFVKQIREYFKESIKADTGMLERFCAALLHGDADEVKRCLAKYLRRTVSVCDTMSQDEQKENFYQGMLVGILSAQESWSVQSNRESGDGYADILIRADDGDLEIGIVIEIKYGIDLDKACKDALNQIEKRRYVEELQNEGMDIILKYGIGFYKKTCKVAMGK